VTGIISKLNPVRADVGNMTVPYIILRHASDEEKEVYNLNNKLEGVKITPIKETAGQGKSFRVGDIVSFDVKGKVHTYRIDKINPTTYDVGNYRARHELVRHATAVEKESFLRAT